ncbi:DHH family phosphoesterase [Elusimicrobiota bacterium]
MNYNDFVREQFDELGGSKVIDLLKSLENEKVLVYAHDDPDGLTSALLLTRLLDKLHIDYELQIPPTMELESGRLINDTKKEKYKAVFLLDKATMSYYNEYSQYVDNFVVIDHHPLDGKFPEKLTVINPQAGKTYKSCSASFLVHMMSEYLGKNEIYDDFLALLGLKGDWAVEPATDVVSEYVRQFYSNRVEQNLVNFIRKIDSTATMFEVRQTEVTTLLNQITELVFALGGGGFGYFYNDRDEELKNIDQRLFAYEVLKKFAGNFQKTEISSLDDFIDMTFEPEIVRKIMSYYREDWKKTLNRFSESVLCSSIGETDIFLFIGSDVKLMPMAGSVYLNQLKRVSGEREVLFAMINAENGGGIHVSLRATSNRLHCGKICSNLAKRLVASYNHKDHITGGGHPFAAECRTRQSGVDLSQLLDTLSKLVKDMETAGISGENGTSEELGLDYLVVKR